MTVGELVEAVAAVTSDVAVQAAVVNHILRTHRSPRPVSFISRPNG